MSKFTRKTQEISYDKLIFWNVNPRYGTNVNYETVETAIKGLFEIDENSRKKMMTLGKDIAELGLFEIPLVYPMKDGNYMVYDGNRRIANVYCLNNPEYVKYNSSLYKTYTDLSNSLSEKPNLITCTIETDLKIILEMVERAHGGVQSGKGPTSWGYSENISFKILKQNILDAISEESATETINEETPEKPKKEVTIAPHFILLTNFPSKFSDDFFKQIGGGTNADRILNNKVFKDAMETDYNNISALQANAIKATLTTANQNSKDKGGISRRYYSTDDIAELIPIYLDFIKNHKDVEFPDKKLILATNNTTITEGEIFDVQAVISNTKDFDEIEYSPSASLSFDSITKRIKSDSKPGSYSVAIKGLIDGFEIDGAIFSVKINKRKDVVTKDSKNILKHDFSKNYEINISSPINSLVAQIQKLNTKNFSYVINACLRVILESSLNIFIAEKKITITGTFSSSLEGYLTEFKKYYNNANITSLDDKSKLGYNKIKGVIDKLKPINIAKELHPLAHQIITIPTDDIKNLSIIVANILVIISEEIK